MKTIKLLMIAAFIKLIITLPTVNAQLNTPEVTEKKSVHTLAYMEDYMERTEILAFLPDKMLHRDTDRFSMPGRDRLSELVREQHESEPELEKWMVDLDDPQWPKEEAEEEYHLENWMTAPDTWLR